jgi:nicotinate-nucleotide adenylyltransferase
MNIAIFGGSFDPFHIGHLDIINKALKELEIDKVVVVPTYLNPFKKKFFLSAKDRLELLSELFENNHKVIIESYEVEQNIPIPSYQTVLYLQQKYNLSKIYFIIGADNLADLHKWDNFDEFEKIVSFVVATRDNISIDSKYKILQIEQDISSTNIRENLDMRYVPEKIRKKVYKIMQILQRIENIKSALDEKKANNIEVIDLQGKNYIVDYVIISTSLNQKHSIALVESLKDTLKPLGEEFLRVDEDENWSIIDLGDMLIHIMTDEYRQRYNLEEFLSKIQNQEEL